ncbi:MAG: hypothetical protein QX189_00070 [Methylococcales bacterium]
MQSLAMAWEIVPAFIASPVLSQITGLNGAAATFAMGFLAGGDSGFWNAILSCILQVKELKKLEVIDKCGE